MRNCSLQLGGWSWNFLFLSWKWKHHVKNTRITSSNRFTKQSVFFLYFVSPINVHLQYFNCDFFSFRLIAKRITDMDVFKVSKSYCLRIAIQIYCYQLARRLYKSKTIMILPTITRSLCTILIITLACVRQQPIRPIVPLAACAQRLHLWILNQRRKHTRPNINLMIAYWPQNIMSHRQYHRHRERIRPHQYLV